MKELLKADIVNLRIWGLLGIIFILRLINIDAKYSLLGYCSIVFGMYHFLENNRSGWINFFIYPKNIWHIVLEKILITIFYGMIACIFFSFENGMYHYSYIVAFSIVCATIFLIYNFLVPDGYVNNYIINPGKVLGSIFMLVSTYYPNDFDKLFKDWYLFVIVGCLMLWSVIFLFSRVRMKKKVVHDIVLHHIMPDIKFAYAVTNGIWNPHAKLSFIDKLVLNTNLRNAIFWYILSYLDMMAKGIQLVLIAIFISIVFEEFLISIFIACVMGIYFLWLSFVNYKKLRKIKIL